MVHFDVSNTALVHFSDDEDVFYMGYFYIPPLRFYVITV